MFDDSNGVPDKALCLKLNKSLCGLREAPKLWGAWLAKGLVKEGFKPSIFDAVVFFGHGMASVVCVDDVLPFGPDEKKMKEVLNKLELQKFGFKVEKDVKDNSCDILGINVVKQRQMAKRSTR